MADTELTVRLGTAADVKPLAAVMARAFYEDPPFAWLLPDPKTRLARLRRVFATMIRSEALRHQTVEAAWVGDEIAGGTIWLPPGHWLAPIGVQLLSLPGYVRAFGRRFGTAAALTQVLARIHPREPHWYLHTIAVDPDHQGHGIAGPLMRSRLRRCDEAGQPVYLESSKPGNVPIYQHFGFEARPAPVLPDGAPTVIPMWRPPASL
jgi:GNAT superfamily N-acetyltransferase